MTTGSRNHAPPRPKRWWWALRRSQWLSKAASQRALSARQLPAGLRSELVPTSFRDRGYWAHPVERGFRATEARSGIARLTVDALRAARVPFFALPPAPGARATLVVCADDRATVWDALEATLAPAGVYVGIADGRRPAHHSLPTKAAAVRQANQIDLFAVHASPEGRFLGGEDTACTVEFWRRTSSAGVSQHQTRHPAGTLIPPRDNPWIEMLTPQEASVTERPWLGTTAPALDLLDHHHIFTTQAPIDLVYTWVDDQDPRWQEAKAEAIAAHDLDERHPLSANASRFSSFDELRFSLRSVEMFADWVRHIYLVTADQTPPWLKKDHPKLTVVSHRELFGPRGNLPTFNSHAIESQLHHIEGLAENFLYLNDDVFIGRPLFPETFVRSNGTALFFPSTAKLAIGEVLAADTPVAGAAKTNRELLELMGAGTITNRIRHAPHSLRRSVLFDLEERFPAELAATAANPFRGTHDVSVASSLGHYYGYATGRSEPAAIHYLYADIARADTPERLKNLLMHRNPDVFCLNDVDSHGAHASTQARMLHDFLGAYFPVPSSFEH